MNILILCPHADDGELACGGTISRLLEEHNLIYYLAFSCASDDERSNEIIKATRILEIDYSIYDFPVRHFPEHRQGILELMLKYKEKINPHWVFLPSSYDTHQDHVVVFQEGFRAFKDRTIFGYECPWNNLSFNTNIFSILQERHVEQKIKIVNQYQSPAHKSFVSEEYVRSAAIFRGKQIGVQYAEVFEGIRWVM